MFIEKGAVRNEEVFDWIVRFRDDSGRSGNYRRCDLRHRYKTTGWSYLAVYSVGRYFLFRGVFNLTDEGKRWSISTRLACL